MKKFFWMAGMILLAASCSNERVDMVDNGRMETTVAPVRVHVDDFAVSMAAFSGGVTRAASSLANYNDINAVTLAFYSGDTEVYKTTQSMDDNATYDTFGEFSLSLPIGSYTMVVLAYYTNENSVMTLTSPTEASFTGLRARETFSAVQTVNITNADAVDIGATLSRINAMLVVASSDGKTAHVKNVRMTLSGGSMHFNPTSGLATDNAGYVNTVGSSVAVGAVSTSATNLFLYTDEQTMDVTIETLDADGNTLFSTTVEDVPFKRNRITILTGAMYTNPGVGGAFLVSTDWLSDYNMSF